MKDIEKILKEFCHGKARLMHFTASHDRLVVRLISSDKKLIKYLILVGCNEISLPVLYEIHEPMIEETGREDEWQYVDTDVRITFIEGYIEDDYPRSF